jgi:hypothetical protein
MAYEVSSFVPEIPVRDYIRRLSKHARLLPPILLTMIYFSDRLSALYPSFLLNSLTIHRFLIAAATVASKGLTDQYYANKKYASVGGIPRSELFRLELELLARLNWKILPPDDILLYYYHGLVEHTPGYELERRHIHGIDLAQRST